jgi:hypothetical protein
VIRHPGTGHSRTARDFADVYVLADRRGREVLLGRAAQVDAGLDTRILVGMLSILDRFTDDEIPSPGGSSVAELRSAYLVTSPLVRNTGQHTSV